MTNLQFLTSFSFSRPWRDSCQAQNYPLTFHSQVWNQQFAGYDRSLLGRPSWWLGGQHSLTITATGSWRDSFPPTTPQDLTVTNPAGLTDWIPHMQQLPWICLSKFPQLWLSLLMRIVLTITKRNLFSLAMFSSSLAGPLKLLCTRLATTTSH